MTALENHRLHRLFHPRSVAVVGASERSPWTQQIMGSFDQYRYDGEIHLINRRGGELFGRTAYTSCAAIGKPVDVALIAIPADAVLDALKDAAAAGIRNAVILTSGFGETGGDGASAERQLVELQLISQAVGRLSAWSRQIESPATPSVSARTFADWPALDTERKVLQYLAGFGVPVVPSALARSADEAVAAAKDMAAERVVLKIASPDITDKTEAGGVKLNLAGATAIRAAYDEIMASVHKHAPDARIEGVLVSPMRVQGIELFVGTARDPLWGPVIVAGLGGVWVEVLKDTMLRLLPITRDDARQMLQCLRAAKLLQGFRGAPRVDLDAAADAIVRIGEAALALGSDLAALEVNPLLAVGSRVEALDGLVIRAK